MKMRKYLAFVMLPAIILIFSTNKAQAFVFGSDVHPEYNQNDGSYNDNLDNLSELLSFFYDDGVGLVGDNVRRGSGTPFQLQLDYYALNYVISQSTYNWNNGNYVTNFMSKGNHDLNVNGEINYKTYNLDYDDYYPFEYDNDYLEVFAINSDYFNDAATPGILYAWLETQRSNGKVKVIMSHFPLHTKRTGVGPTPQAQTDIYNVIDYWTRENNPARNGGALDIVFLWGHNHDADLQQRENIDKIAVPGEKMAISYNPQYNHPNADKILNFTYLNAGFVLKEDGGHMTQINAWREGYYIVRCGINGWENCIQLQRKNVQ
ncbi:MAG TPA: metallophosphoesterase [Chitinispirillaceae bacterium]|nr:metallophosphoesterase [Chitinispirillaceae bacterium]